MKESVSRLQAPPLVDKQSVGQENKLEKKSKSTSSAVFAKDSFACCSYYKECSNEKHCIISNLDYSQNCQYREKIESGIIYYGKNANAFRKDLYESYIHNFQHLSLGEVSILGCVLHHFFFEKNGITQAIFLDSPELLTLSELGFFDITFKPLLIMNRCKIKYLKNACGDSLIKEAVSWAKKQRKATPKNNLDKNSSAEESIYREELVRWILQFHPNIAETVCEGVHVIEIPPMNHLELREFFYDYYPLETYETIKEALKYYTDDPRFLAAKKHEESPPLLEDSKKNDFDMAITEAILQFGYWDPDVHSTLEQVKRLAAMLRIKPKNITVNVDNLTAEIIGSTGDHHHVSLTSCSCMDFHFRQLPCKHIYRLAYELGCLNSLPKFDRKSAEAFEGTIPDEVERFRRLYLKGAISPEKYVKIVNALESTNA